MSFVSSEGLESVVWNLLAEVELARAQYFAHSRYGGGIRRVPPFKLTQQVPLGRVGGAARQTADPVAFLQVDDAHVSQDGNGNTGQMREPCPRVERTVE